MYINFLYYCFKQRLDYYSNENASRKWLVGLKIKHLTSIKSELYFPFLQRNCIWETWGSITVFFPPEFKTNMLSYGWKRGRTWSRSTKTENRALLLFFINKILINTIINNFRTRRQPTFYVNIGRVIVLF